MTTLTSRPIDFNTIKVSENPIDNLKFKIRHNLVDDQPKARRQLERLIKKAS